MGRKKKIFEEAESLKLKLKDLEDELIEIEEKRKADTEKLNEHIKKEYGEYFVGSILTIEDVFALLRLLQHNETVKIPINLYNGA